jgi:hypothetical protein
MRKEKDCILKYIFVVKSYDFFFVNQVSSDTIVETNLLNLVEPKRAESSL